MANARLGGHFSYLERNFYLPMYVTRFAPTPSGPLHFGSLITLLGAFLRSRALKGKLLIRIEDLDTPRCPQGMAELILDEIKSLGLSFDDEVLYQSKNLRRYEERLKELNDKGLVFKCSCSRDDLRQRPCQCLKCNDILKKQNISLRLNSKALKEPNASSKRAFTDELLGELSLPKLTNFNDEYLTLKRRDGIFSYNFACVVDDIDTGVTEIVRGADLIEVTPEQLSLYKAFNQKAPHYLHLPLALENSERKLSKQNHAKNVLEVLSPQDALREALIFLDQDVSYIKGTLDCKDILNNAIAHFNLNAISKAPKLAPKCTCE